MMKTILTVIGGMLLGSCLSACSSAPQILVLHDPLTPEEHVTLGLSYEVQGQQALAAREYRTALSLESGCVPALVGLGNVALAEGALEESETYYRRALAFSPNHQGANNNLAILYLARGTNLREAERLALQALSQRGPLEPYVLDTLAQVYIQQGRYTEASAALDEAQAAAPAQNTILHQRLLRMREQILDIQSQEEPGKTGEPEIRPNPEQHRDGDGQESAIEQVRGGATGDLRKDIADALDLNEKTAKNRVRHTFHELQVHDRAQAAILAIRQGTDRAGSAAAGDAPKPNAFQY